jgi:hypothetical protein
MTLSRNWGGDELLIHPLRKFGEENKPQMAPISQIKRNR